jgi:ATP-dependent exoDNAse (exonuclease V) alpha subunit
LPLSTFPIKRNIATPPNTVAMNTHPIRQVLTIAFLIAQLSLSAQTNTQTPEFVPYIESTGTVELLVVPDQIFLRISLQERYKNRIKITVDAQETQLKAAILSLGIPIEKLSLADANADYVKIRRNTKSMRNWLLTDLLIIDEVSMMTAELLDKLNELGKKIRKSTKPFGGIQVLLVGDFYQLPPVNRGDEKKSMFYFV